MFCRWSTDENGVCEELDGLGAMELAMGAWADWVASKVDPLKKRVFFVSMSPTHLWWVPKAFLSHHLDIPSLILIFNFLSV